MVCLFMILMSVFLIVDQHLEFKVALKRFRNFVLSSMVSALLAAFLLLPTWWSLSQSKTQYTVTSMKWNFEFFPPKMLSKFFVGAFNTSQLPSGTANLFVGAIVLVGFLFYFWKKEVSARTKITAGIITTFLILSMCFQPLDLLWHAGQFPVWYPYRFSFVVGFWMAWLASQTITWDFKPTKVSILSVSINLFFAKLKIELLKLNVTLFGNVTYKLLSETSNNISINMN